MSLQDIDDLVGSSRFKFLLLKEAKILVLLYIVKFSYILQRISSYKPICESPRDNGNDSVDYYYQRLDIFSQNGLVRHLVVTICFVTEYLKVNFEKIPIHLTYSPIIFFPNILRLTALIIIFCIIRRTFTEIGEVIFVYASGILKC